MKRNMAILAQTALPALVIAAALCAFSSAARADAHSVAWTGIDFGPDSAYGYIGGFTALSGQSVDQEGWLAFAGAGYGRVHYDTGLVPGGKVVNHMADGNVMIGYQALSAPATAKFFIGPDFETSHDSPRDPVAHLGERTGAKAQLETTTKFSDNIEFGAMGNYSTAFQSYWSRVNTNYKTPWFSVGPEAMFLGSDSYNQMRFGGAVSDLRLGPVSFALDAGNSIARGNSKNGAYGGLSVGGAF